MTGRAFAIAALLVTTAPMAVLGQTVEPSRPFVDVAVRVAIDPTTYVPAIISYKATMFDWKTSQMLFANGWVEANQRFTVSGRPNDTPLAYDTGKSRIRRTSLAILGYSVLNNGAVAVGERLLVRRYPTKRKLIRVLSWAERIAYASVTAYVNSHDHIRQGRENQRLAREYGYSSER